MADSVDASSSAAWLGAVNVGCGGAASDRRRYRRLRRAQVSGSVSDGGEKLVARLRCLMGVMEAGPEGTRLLAPVVDLAEQLLVVNEGLRAELARARSDELTGLLARAAFLEAAAERARAAHGTGVILLDLDGFKSVNDRFGHAAGDAVLRASGLRLMDWCGRGEQGGVAGRLGGDEFVAMVTSAVPESVVVRRTARLRRLIERPVPFEGRLLSVGASIGYCSVEDGDVLLALRQADHLMYQDKAARRTQSA